MDVVGVVGAGVTTPGAGVGMCVAIFMDVHSQLVGMRSCSMAYLVPHCVHQVPLFT